MNVQELKELIEKYNKDIELGFGWIRINYVHATRESNQVLANAIIIRNDLIKQLDRELQKETTGEWKVIPEMVVGQDNGR